MATLEEVKEEIGQLRLEHGNQLTHETLIEPMLEQLKKIEERMGAQKKKPGRIQRHGTLTKSAQDGLLGLGLQCWQPVVALLVLLSATF